MEPPVEPDLYGPWRRNVWIYGLRVPFSLIFLGWITFAQALSPAFSFKIYSLTLLASFLGLVVGAHYIDIATSIKKFSPYFPIPAKKMLVVGILGVLAGVSVGMYLAIILSLPIFLIFVLVEGFAAIAYPREISKPFHSYFAFGLTWGSLPFLACYFVQARSFSLLSLAVSAFVGISVVIMHHIAIMTRESSDWKNALYLLKLYRYSIYILAIVSLLGRLL
ncbi:MAG: hypothetical protein QXG05_02545 [Nitrososphaerota archaeon]